MLNGAIQNPVASGVWLASGALIAAWYAGRRRALRDIKDDLRDRSGEAAEDRRSRAQGRAILEAFVGGFAWIALFVILDAMF